MYDYDAQCNNRSETGGIFANGAITASFAYVTTVAASRTGAAMQKQSRKGYEYDAVEVDESGFSNEIRYEIYRARRDGLSTTPPHEEGFGVVNGRIVRADAGPPCSNFSCSMQMPILVDSTFHLHPPLRYNPGALLRPSIADLKNVMIKTPGPDYIITEHKLLRIDNISKIQSTP